MKLICSNEECESEDSLFDVHITVDGDREVAESLNKIEPENFICCFCHSPAEEIS